MIIFQQPFIERHNAVSDYKSSSAVGYSSKVTFILQNDLPDTIDTTFPALQPDHAAQLTGFVKFRSLQKYPVAIVEKILSIELLEGKVQLKMQNWRFNLCGMSFRPPPGWIMAPTSWMSAMLVKSPG